MPPEHENKSLVWPYWPLKLRTSSSHDEGAEKGVLKREFAISTKAFMGKNGQLTGLKTVHVEMKDGKLTEDDLRDTETEVQKLTDKIVVEIDKQTAAKEAELMKV